MPCLAFKKLVSEPPQQLVMFLLTPKVITEDSWGVKYRALNDLFQISKQRKDTFIYEVAVQMIEIYNEQVRGILVLDSSNKIHPS